MTSIRKSAAMLLIAGTTLFAFQGCKKGDNDPALSLSSRKSRLAGEWKLSKMTQTTTDASGSSTTTYDGQTMTENSGGSTNSWGYSLKYTFEKDGTFEKVEITPAGTSTRTGVWAFGGKNKAEGIKAKETVVLSYKTSTSGSFTTTWTGTFEADDSFILDRLAGKEMVWLADGSTINSSSSGTTTSTTTGTMTFEQ